jgi:hypothetical protein
MLRIGSSVGTLRAGMLARLRDAPEVEVLLHPKMKGTTEHLDPQASSHNLALTCFSEFRVQMVATVRCSAEVSQIMPESLYIPDPFEKKR